MPKRKDYERKTNVHFKKTYGNRVYSFAYEKTEIPGYTSVLITVRRKKKGESKLRVGELVHMILLQDEEDAA